MKFFNIILVLSLFLVKCFAYGGNGDGGISLAGPQSTVGVGSYDASSGTGGISLAGSGGGNIAGPISLSGPSRSNGVSSYSGGGGGGGVGRYQAAIFTKHSVETRPVMTSNELSQPSIIEVDGGDIPIEVVFLSRPSRLKVRQQHVAGSGSQIQETNSEEPASILRNTVRRPIIQEIREIIQPYRRVVQELHPVQEVIETIVARAQSQASRGQDGGGAPQIRNGGNGAVSLGGTSGLNLDLNTRSFAGGQSSANGAIAGVGTVNSVGVGAGANIGAGTYSAGSGNSLTVSGGRSLPVNVPVASAGTKGGY